MKLCARRSLACIGLGFFAFTGPGCHRAAQAAPSASVAGPGDLNDLKLKQDIDDFHQWFDSHYGKPPAVKLVPTGDNLRMGVVAAVDLKPDQLYLEIPMKVLIGRHNMFDTPVVGPFLSNFLERNPHRLYETIALFLIHQRFVAGKDSFFEPYIRLLPAAIDQPANFSDEELGYMNGTRVPDAIRGVRSEIQGRFAFFRENVIDDSPHAPFPSNVLTEENWLWANGIMSTRMIHVDGSPRLVPLLDMINCRQGPMGYETRLHHTFGGGDGRAHTKAPWAFKAGEQIFENYGQPNPTYMTYHGFAIEPNLADCADVTLHIEPGAMPGKAITAQGQAALAALGNRRRQTCVAGAPFPGRRGGVDTLLELASVAVGSGRVDLARTPAVARIKKLKPKRAALLMAERSIKTALDGFPSEVPYSGEREGEAGIEARAKWLSRMESGSAGESPVPFRRRMAVFFRETQRARLLEALSEVRQRMESLPKPKKVKRKSPEPHADEMGTDDRHEDL